MHPDTGIPGTVMHSKNEEEIAVPRPVHFEIPAENPERAMQFYTTLFGWKFQKWDGPMDYWMIFTGQTGEPGIDGGLMPRRDPAQPCVNTIGVANLDQSL